MPDISVLMPSIRPTLLEGVYNSISESFHGSWELVVVGPYQLPEELATKTNITSIIDCGSPTRARQIGLTECTGNYICYAADDVTFYPNSLDIAFNTLKDKNYKTLVVGKYMEGKEDNPEMAADFYWSLYSHDMLKPIISEEKHGYFLINTGLISRKYMNEIGGFDCCFDACAMACVDLSIRLQNDGGKCILQNEPIFHSTHLPGMLGDHAPIDTVQVTHDQPLFFSMYYNGKNSDRTVIDINNWQKQPARWVRRFGHET